MTSPRPATPSAADIKNVTESISCFMVLGNMLINTANIANKIHPTKFSPAIRQKTAPACRAAGSRCAAAGRRGGGALPRRSATASPPNRTAAGASLRRAGALPGASLWRAGGVEPFCTRLRALARARQGSGAGRVGRLVGGEAVGVLAEVFFGGLAEFVVPLLAEAADEWFFEELVGA